MKQNVCLQLFSQPTKFVRDNSTIFLGDALDFYDMWETPTVIISDGPYGLGSYPGDPDTH